MWKEFFSTLLLYINFFHFINPLAGHFLPKSFNSLPRGSQVVHPLKELNAEKKRTNHEKVARKDFLNPGVLIEYRSSVTMIAGLHTCLLF